MDESKQSRVEKHIAAVVTMALRSFVEVQDGAPTLPGVPSAREELVAALISDAIQEVRAFRPESERPALLLARLATTVARALHNGLCSRRGRQNASCQKDAAAAQRIIESIALSLFDLQVHGQSAEVIRAAANAQDLTEEQRLDGLAARLAELLHLHPGRREALEIIDGAPIFGLNAPYRTVSRPLFQKNRATNQSLAEVVTRRGFRPDVTSDYAPYGQKAPRQEYLVRNGLLRLAAVCLLTNGAGIGTGRAIELANSTLTPMILLRRVTKEEPAPHNNDRFSGEVTGLVEYQFSSIEEAQELLEGFLSAEADNIQARQRELVLLDNGPVPREALAMLGADASAFHGLRMSIEDAGFWADSLAFPYAGPARKHEMREALGLPRVPTNATEHSHGSNATDGAPAEERSMRSLAAYARVENIGPERVLRLWSNRFAYGPSDDRRELPHSFEDWQDMDRRREP